MDEVKRFTEEEAHLLFAKQIHGRVWELLEKLRRSQLEDEEMLHAAHASLFHWLYAGKPVNHQRGEWMIARVHTVLGNASEALRHAERCLQLTEQYRGEMADFDLAFAEECAARAYALAGKHLAALKHLRLAELAGDAIADSEDREIFFQELNGGLWCGLRS
jgi:hypothetical protein